tara:strand:- start:259 stop:375 length:117 start_codon:yes stop_codon:yes gene_type:complete
MTGFIAGLLFGFGLHYLLYKYGDYLKAEAANMKWFKRK